MPIISNIEARSIKGRILIAAIFTVLTLGGLTMVYPFLIMLSGSLRSEMDQTDLDVVPSFLLNQDVLYRKFAETKYSQRMIDFNRANLVREFSFRDIPAPKTLVPQQARDLEEFMANLPAHWQVLGGITGNRTVPEPLRELRRRLEVRFNGDLNAFSREVGAPVLDWSTILIAMPEWMSMRYDHDRNAVFEVYFQMLWEAAPANRVPLSVTGMFLDSMIYPAFGSRDVKNANAGLGLSMTSFADFVLPQRVPGKEQAKLRALWIEFVRKELNPSFVLVRDDSEQSVKAWRELLREKYEEIDILNSAWAAKWDTKYARFEEIELPSGQWIAGAARADYKQFLETRPDEALMIIGPDFAWRDWLVRKYGKLEDLTQAHQAGYASFEVSRLPLAQLDYQYAVANARHLRFTYAVRNYINVFDELFSRGRAFVNTIILCALSILTALIINPLAAYAMSRYQLPGTYKILLFLMATMSFPPMVTMIPTFILLRNLDMLNTFAALVLPAAANGYAIFLLKGFFDSLPRDLYEAATIDGAGEVRIFFQITMALSTPILAVVALGAFNGAYATFLHALLVCPREDMWMLSVWLYQFQSRSNTPGVFASVIVSSIPTLVVFVLAQNIIMRGIVVPTEK